MMLDDLIPPDDPRPRHEIAAKVWTEMCRPFAEDTEAREEHDRAEWARLNVEAMAGMGGEDDPYMARPVDHAAIAADRGVAMPGGPPTPPLPPGMPT